MSDIFMETSMIDLSTDALKQINATP